VGQPLCNCAFGLFLWTGICHLIGPLRSVVLGSLLRREIVSPLLVIFVKRSSIGLLFLSRSCSSLCTTSGKSLLTGFWVFSDMRKKIHNIVAKTPSFTEACEMFDWIREMSRSRIRVIAPIPIRQLVSSIFVGHDQNKALSSLRDYDGQTNRLSLPSLRGFWLWQTSSQTRLPC
jgi:hypothetical protein